MTMLFNYYGYNIDISELKAKNSVGRNGLSLAKLKEICQENYFQFKAYKNFSSENDLLMNLPAILFSKTNHYVVVSRKRNNTFELLDPVKGKIQVSFDDIQREYMDILVVIRPSDFIETIATTFTTISPMLLYTMGGFLIINSNLELGALVSFITLSTYFTGPFQTLSLIIPQISVLRETMLRINELMNYSDEIQSGKQSIGRFESISLKNVTFKYLGSNEPDLKGINITIKRGEKIAIVGESGSGKTTISKLLLNALTKYEGEILLNGYNINSIKREAIDHIFTIVTQVPMAISGTIRDNIDISHDLSDDEIYSCLKTAELENDVNKFPMKLNTFVGENGQNISGGQKQRIAIARALALKPEVLILDEATSNLDPITERKICDNLKKLHITQIIITHRLSQVEDADMIYVLNHGEIMEKGSHEQLMKGKGLYSKLVRIA